MIKAAHIRDIVIPHFEKYPLFAKKSRDFVLWKQAFEICDLARESPYISTGRKGFQTRWTDSILNQLKEIVDALKVVRRFEINGNSLPLPERLERDWSQPSLF